LGITHGFQILSKQDQMLGLFYDRIQK
jgi:hypothetical protein